MVQIDFDEKAKLFTLTNMKGDDFLVPGTELKELEFDGFLDWFVSITDPALHWKYQPTYILVQCVYIFGGLATLTHALSRGGRLPLLWLGILWYGIVTEFISYFVPDVDNFWHSQTPIIFLGRRLPLHIMLVYPCFVYSATIAVAKMKLSRWAEPFAVGLITVLIDLPYDIVSVRFNHWVWHDTDPNIGDRHYFVPWTSYFFHAAFSAAFTFCFHGLRSWLCPSEGKWILSKRYFRELIVTILAGILGPMGGVLLFIAVYHPLHDELHIHTEVCFFIVFTIFFLITWTGDRTRKNIEFSEQKGKHKVHWSTWLSCLHLVAHFSLFLSMVVFFNPEDEISTGLKETVGPCDVYVPLRTAYGKTLKKRKYLCASNHTQYYFDWSCRPGTKPPSDGSSWYSTCGVPFTNRAEYVVIASLIHLAASVVFSNLHFRYYGDDVFSEKYKTTGARKQEAKRKRN